ncbi:MAG: hypothetical protein ACOYON_06840 [Fimbriimonas sp.]
MGKTALIAIVGALVVGGGYYAYLYQSEYQRIAPGATTRYDGPQAEAKPLDEQIKDLENNKDVPAPLKMMALGRLKAKKAAEDKAAADKGKTEAKQAAPK